MNQQIVEDVGGTVWLDHSVPGRPSAATVAVYDSAGTELVASTSATIDAVTTTLSTGASAGDSTVTLTAVTNITRGRTYLLSNATNFPEWVRVRAINAGTLVVTLDEPLGFTYSSGAAFVGTRVTYSVSSTTAATRGKNLEARWAITVASVAYAERTFLDVVRTRWPDTILRADQWRQFAGDRATEIREHVLRKGDDFEFVIERAQSDVLTDIMQRELDPSLFRNFDSFRKPIAYRVICNRAELGEGIPAAYRDQPGEWIDLRARLYSESLAEALSTCGTYDEDDSNAVGAGEKKARHGAIRLVR